MKKGQLNGYSKHPTRTDQIKLRDKFLKVTFHPLASHFIGIRSDDPFTGNKICLNCSLFTSPHATGGEFGAASKTTLHEHAMMDRLIIFLFLALVYERKLLPFCLEKCQTISLQ